ncbi:MAG: hypothetical protein U0235_13600 [Polyangiaceae bacterium]
MVTISPDAAATPRPNERDGSARRLLHRWFVQYNPFYVLSAALVLGGMLAWQAGAATSEASLRVAAVSELYAWSLVLSAALLVRIGQRRSAVMLALLACLYEWDVALVTETSAYLGAAGTVAGALFVASGIGTVAALGAALRVRFSRAVFASVAIAASGLVLFPRLLVGHERSGAELLFGAWLLLLGSLPRRDAVVSKVALDAWGRTVLERATSAAYTLSFLLVFLHVGFWCSRFGAGPDSFVAAFVLLLVPRIRSELGVWGVIAVISALAYAMPSAMSVVAALIALSLALRLVFPAFYLIRVRTIEPSPAPSIPYRAPSAEAPDASPLGSAFELVPGRVVGAERARTIAGIVLMTHVAVWTFGWRGHACLGAAGFPPHVLALDLALALNLVFVAWRSRTLSAIVPGLPVLADLALEIVPRPTTAFGWGLSTIVSGFALFLGSLVVSYWLRDVEAPVTQRPSSAGS